MKNEKIFNYTVYYFIEDEEMRKYLESNGTKIVTIELNGKKRMYALIPCETQEEADKLNRSLNSMKKKDDRKKAKQRLLEVSLDNMTASGYTPNLSMCKTPQNIPAEQIHSKHTFTNNSNSENSATTSTNDTDFGTYGKKEMAPNGYNSSTDENNPEFIYMNSVLLKELAALVDDLDDEKVELIKMIITGQSERSKAEELGLNRTTLQKRKYALLQELKEKLKDFYED